MSLSAALRAPRRAFIDVFATFICDADNARARDVGRDCGREGGPRRRPVRENGRHYFVEISIQILSTFSISCVARRDREPFGARSTDAPSWYSERYRARRRPITGHSLSADVRLLLIGLTSSRQRTGRRASFCFG